MVQLETNFGRLQRVRGSASVGLEVRRGGTRLVRLAQVGAAKVMLPGGSGAVPELVFLNTAGGLTGGDRLRYAADLAPGCRAVATTQTAERVYASSGGAAEVEVTLAVGPGGALDWLPQETILFDRSALVRRTEVALADGARCLIAETVVLGRAAMGEALRSFSFRDTRTIRRDGRPVLVEALGFGPDSLRCPASLAGVRALATVALVAPGAEDALPPVRRALDEPGVEAGASGWDGKCVVRLIGPDAAPVRRQLARLLEVLRQAPLPRVWQIRGESP